MSPGDTEDGRVIEGALCGAVPIGRDAADRRPRLRQDAVLGVHRSALRLGEIGMQFNLVDSRHHVRLRQQRLEVFRQEVADADRPHLAVGQQRLKRPVGLDRPIKGGRQRLVQQQQVDLLDPQLGCALIERVERLVIAVVADPDLGLDEDLSAIYTGAADRVADLALVPVRRCRVDVPIPRSECGPDGMRRLLGRSLKHAQADAGNLDTVVQVQIGCCRHVNAPGVVSQVWYQRLRPHSASVQDAVSGPVRGVPAGHLSTPPARRRLRAWTQQQN